VSRKSDNYPLVFVGGGLGLFALLHAIWSILFEDWVKQQLEHFVGHTVAEMLEKFGSVGFPLLGMIGIIWFLIAYNRDSKSKATASDEEEFFKSAYVYCEATRIKWEDGEESRLFENQFYVVVGNALETRKTLKRVQARIFHLGEPVLSQVKETGQTDIDLRNGEIALFGIGKIVSPEIFGILSGSATVDAKAKLLYANNIPRGGRTYEVSSFGKRGYGLGYMPQSPSAEWTIWVIVSADDAIAMQVRVNINLLAKESPVTCETVK
jgi:hypothetical protein